MTAMECPDHETRLACACHRTAQPDNKCSCGRLTPEDYYGPRGDCPEHGDPQLLGYCPFDQYEVLRSENERLRARVATLEDRLSTAVPKPARPGDDGIAKMYAEGRATEFGRLRDLMAEAIHEDALCPEGQRIGIIDAILAVPQLRRPFEERDRLRANARYWIDYACAYAEGQKRAEAAVVQIREYAEATDSCGVRTRQKVLRLLDTTVKDV
ncbi:hypothetical protein ACFU99_25825 [Streptomyces sp. NPDC057654]|uniref:hypothetical protein n=1 Tax=Streptomyces sp. NPDC057654 TaxID=3346196 RepID=UPI00368DF421